MPSLSSHSSFEFPTLTAVGPVGRLSMEKGGAKHLVLCVGPPFCAPRAFAPIDDAAPGAASVRGFKELAELRTTPETHVVL